MNLDFTSEQDMLRDTVSRFLANECPYDRVKELEETAEGYSPELWQKMAELGWLGLLFPEEYEGYEGQFIDMIIIQEEIGKAVFPNPLFSTVIQCGSIILEGGSEEQKKELLGQIAEGSLIMALAQYEEDGSYLSSGIKMPAEADGDRYILNGTKMFVMDANISDKLIVAANIKDKGLSLLLVDAKDTGITITKIPTIGKDNTCEVIFKDVRVAKENIIGSPGNGLEILEKINAKAAVAKAAEMVGSCKACIDITIDYAKQREQYGKPIGGFQVIQHYMANMLLAYDTSYNYLYRVACMVDEGEDFTAEASALKACLNENYKFVSERAVQIHGGIGTTREGDIGLFYRKAKSCEYICGDTDFHYENLIDKILSANPI
ncbi:MAG: acyl-CoA/acyl-ACP dehydrogenase [Deltaproteobacteria bacterium]|nr:acyl-CoA/acyl-ACP dehydrogenase [Deltaproteobacteria bacterium]MBW2051269.1 acyl-CoA/acyl-ACP dehydrogenase [Deltaproteobacteria bacterium]MBW2139921.1 acyl-CoA/acyl-ACP dehydrogenase [Deltaproteobacteria bacterium]MBW2322386.1 acyl-CoA/acyl-ACP dehydrogenase [Deltaproteobacteria bacterium]